MHVRPLEKMLVTSVSPEIALCLRISVCLSVKGMYSIQRRGLIDTRAANIGLCKNAVTSNNSMDNAGTRLKVAVHRPRIKEVSGG